MTILWPWYAKPMPSLRMCSAMSSAVMLKHAACILDTPCRPSRCYVRVSMTWHRTLGHQLQQHRQGKLAARGLTM